MKNQIGDIKKKNNEESEMKTVAIVDLRIKAKFLHTPKSKRTYSAGATYRSITCPYNQRSPAVRLA